MRSTHTYVVLEISPEAHAEIKAKLLAAGYSHAIDGETVDMQGIAVEPERQVMQFSALSSAILPQPTVAEALGLDLENPVALSSISQHYPEGVLIDSHGNLSGDPVAIEEFREYCRVRPSRVAKPGFFYSAPPESEESAESYEASAALINHEAFSRP